MKTLRLIVLLIFMSFALLASIGSQAYGQEPRMLKEGNILRIVRVDVDPKMEGEFNRWYNSEHEKLLLKVPGVIWTYRGINLGDKGQKYFYLYLHENMDVQKSAQYKAASQTDWAKEVRPFLRNFEGLNYEVIVPGPVLTHFKKGSIIRTVQVNVESAYDADFNKWYNEEHIPMLKNVPGVMAVWRGKNLGDKGQQYLTVYFHENIQVQARDDYKKASQTELIKSLMPHLKDLSGMNYEIQF